MTNELIIHIYERSDEPGYNFDLYRNEDELNEQKVQDGGVTDSVYIKDALKEAIELAEKFIN